MALEIYGRFVKVESALEVNVDMLCREAILERIEAGNFPVTLFDDALKTVFEMLKFGVYREFALTKEFLAKYPVGAGGQQASQPVETELAELVVEKGVLV